MKRGSLFLVAFATAAITFGSLMAFMGPQQSGWHPYRYGWHGGWRHHHRYNEEERFERRPAADSARPY